MPRIRSIKPEFFTSTSIADLTLAARLMFVGMWTHVDDEGRCLDEPRLLKAALWPLDDDMTPSAVDGLLAELECHGRIVRYEVDGKRIIQIQGWDHQKIDRKKDSKFPPVSDRSSTDRRQGDDPSSPDLGGDQGSDQGGDERATRRHDVATTRRPLQTGTELADRITNKIAAAHPGAPPPRNNDATRASAQKLLDRLALAGDPELALDEMFQALEFTFTNDWWTKKAPNAQAFCSNYDAIHADWRGSSKTKAGGMADLIEAL